MKHSGTAARNVQLPKWVPPPAVV